MIIVVIVIVADASVLWLVIVLKGLLLFPPSIVTRFVSFLHVVRLSFRSGLSSLFSFPSTHPLAFFHSTGHVFYKDAQFVLAAERYEQAIRELSAILDLPVLGKTNKTEQQFPPRFVTSNGRFSFGPTPVAARSSLLSVTDVLIRSFSSAIHVLSHVPLTHSSNGSLRGNNPSSVAIAPSIQPWFGQQLLVCTNLFLTGPALITIHSHSPG